MKPCRTKTFFIRMTGCAVGLMGLVAYTTPLWAQDPVSPDGDAPLNSHRPIVLKPQGQTQDNTSQAIPLSPALRTDDTSGTNDIGDTVEMQDNRNIEIGVIESLGVDTASVPGVNIDQVPPLLWLGTPDTIVTHLMENFPPTSPQVFPSATIGDMARTVLLARTAPPKGQQYTEVGSYILWRLRTLINRGALYDAKLLLNSLPAGEMSAEIDAINTDLLLLQGEFALLCAALQTDDTTSGVLKNQILNACRSLRGDKVSARLHINIMRERGLHDALYISLLEGILSKTRVVLPEEGSISSLHIALAYAGNAILPDSLQQAYAPVLALLRAKDSALDVPERAQAAEMAVLYGAMSVAEWGNMLTTFPHDATMLLNNGVTDTEEEILPEPSAEHRALWYITAIDGKTPLEVKAEVMSFAFQSLRDEQTEIPRYRTIARLFAPIIRTIEARSDLAWFAKDAILALYLAGDSQFIMPWLTLLKNAAQGTRERLNDYAGVSAYLWLAGDKTIPANTLMPLSVWQNTMRAEPDFDKKQLVLYSLLEALGHNVETAQWRDMGMEEMNTASDSMPTIAASPSSPSSLSPSALRNWLHSAANAAYVGETLLLSLHLLHQEATGNPSSRSLYDVVDILSRIGLTHQARRIAIEAALMQGL